MAVLRVLYVPQDSRDTLQLVSRGINYDTLKFTVFFSELLQDFDPFRAQKENGFFSSMEAMSSVGDQLVKLIEGGKNKTVPNQAEFQHFLMVQLTSLFFCIIFLQ